MEQSELVAFLTFAFVTAYTPGPNNISSASMGVLHGYRGTLPYILGIISGFFVVMLLSSWISTVILTILPSFELILRIFGSLYILWLAYHTLRATYAFDEKDQKKLGYGNGALLQALNPKGMVYGLTIFSSFLAPLTGNLFSQLVAALGLTAIGFSAVSTWALFGAGIRTYLRHARFRQAVNIVLAVLLVYTALDLSGLLDLLFG
jgi:cysteine/O-acetylserine efflux protein